MPTRSADSRTDTPPPSPVIQQLNEELAAASASGRAVFLQVPPGSTCVAQFVHEARRSNRRLRTAVANAADPTTPAWRQIAFRLTGRHRAGAALRRSLEAWVSMVPLIGPVISAVMNTAAELRGTPEPGTAAAGTGSTIDDVRRILAHGRNDLRLIVLENCEAADAAELAGAFALIQQLRTTRTLLLVIASAAAGRGGSGFTDLLWEAERAGVGRRLVDDAGLHPEEAELITCAARLGERFEVAHLVHLLGRSEALIESQLGALSRANVISLVGTIERDGDLVDIYGFVDPSQRQRWRTAPPVAAPSAES